MTAFLLGITGPIGAGKSTVLQLLRERGVTVLDGDALVRDEQTRGTLGYAAIVQQFGTDVLDRETREIDRARLGAIVFSDPAKLKQLEGIMHPRVVARVLEARARLPDDQVLVAEAIRIIGSAMERLYDRIWVVLAPRATLVDRLTVNRGMSEDDIFRRLSSQLTDEKFRARADTVIENTGDRIALEKAVDAAWKDLCAPRRQG